MPVLRPRSLLVSASLIIGAAACGSDPITNPGTGEPLACDLDERFLADGGVGRDGIPALTNPTFVPATPVTASNRYVEPNDRVLALWHNGEWLLIPHKIMYRHEIVNLDGVTVSYCPLTGTGLAFDQSSIDGAEMGVSGLLYQANLVLYDRNDPDVSLWPQMFSQARCGPRSGNTLARVPLVEARYEEWLQLHPDSKVVALTVQLFNEALYFSNPYGPTYENPTNADFLGFPMPNPDTRLRPKDRVLGIPTFGAAKAFPFVTMGELGVRGAFRFEHNGREAVVFWDDEAEAASAFFSTVDGQSTSFTAVEEGVMDELTGTVWSIAGTPVSGPLAGSTTRLDAIPEAYVSFWRPFAAFFPGTEFGVPEIEL